MQTQRPNPLAALLGRPASSFTVAELDALPLGTSFGGPGATAEDSLSFSRTPKGWADMFGTETSEKLRNISFGSLVCIAVGELPEAWPATLGRSASSFTVEQLDALPQHTAFGRPDLFGKGDLERFAYASNGDGRWCSAVGPVDSATLRVVSGLVCIAVGDALTALDHALPRPTRSLREVAEAASAPLLAPRVIDLPPRAARISAADMEEPLELVYRLRKWCGRTGADLSLLVDAHRVNVMFIGNAKPDLVSAVQVGGHRQHTDAAGTVTTWRAS